MGRKSIKRKAKYIGPIDYFEGIYDINSVIHDGEPIGNGETNQSGQNIYCCSAENEGVPGVWIFREDEIELIKR